MTQDQVSFQRAIGKESKSEGIGSEDSMEVGGARGLMVTDVWCTPIAEQIFEGALSLMDQV